MDKLSWSSIKKDLWKQKPQELIRKLKELQLEKQNMEIYLRMDGHLGHRMGYPPSSNKKEFKNGNLKELRHRIACIKTILNQGGE